MTSHQNTPLSAREQQQQLLIINQQLGQKLPLFKKINTITAVSFAILLFSFFYPIGRLWIPKYSLLFDVLFIVIFWGAILTLLGSILVALYHRGFYQKRFDISLRLVKSILQVRQPVTVEEAPLYSELMQLINNLEALSRRQKSLSVKLVLFLVLWWCIAYFIFQKANTPSADRIITLFWTICGLIVVIRTLFGMLSIGKKSAGLIKEKLSSQERYIVLTQKLFAVEWGEETRNLL